MTTATTNGIKISVETEYQQEYSSPAQMHFVFTYRITIENQSENTIQLLRRHWDISDVTHSNRQVDGEGVVGKQPILEGQYDLIVEQTFFCAIDRRQRSQYVTKTHELLRQGGKLVGLLWKDEFNGGPPFGGSEEEYRRLFEPYFEIELMEVSYNSIKPRAGRELFIKLVKK